MINSSIVLSLSMQKLLEFKKYGLPKIPETSIIENMKIIVEINNLSACRVGEDFFIRTIEETLKRSGYYFLAQKNVSVSVALVKPAEIKKLNKVYRKKDAVTDVLSFAEYKTQKSLAAVGDKEVFLGELVLCYNDIKEYAKKNKEDVRRELAKVVAHGLLHLLGFRHGARMFRLQDSVADTISAATGK